VRCIYKRTISVIVVVFIVPWKLYCHYFIIWSYL